MHDILMTEQFRKDLDNLDKAIRERVPKTIRQIATDPDHPSLDTKKQLTIRNRKIMRSRVTDKYRLLWEWVSGSIYLWRVGNHEFIDDIVSLPSTAGTQWKFVSRNDVDHTAVEARDWRNDLNQPQPFRHVPLNHLRLFGVPDDQLDDVRNLLDLEVIWDMAIPKNVKDTLIDILTKGGDWTADSFLDTRQLLYRTTADQLAGYCEGKIKRLLLNLTPEQMEYVHIKATGPILIKGVAGSGKTTIGLYRANYLAERIEKQRQMFGENAAILLLTYTKTLAKALHQLYEELYGELPYAITISTYDSWTLEQLQRNGVWKSVATQDQRYSFIRQAQNEIAQKYPQDKVISRRPLDFLLDELDTVIRARWPTKFNDYRTVNRVGRGIALQEKHRGLVWEICVRYQRLLDEAGLFDWKDLPRLMQKYCPSLPQYDVVIIDEAQDLPPSHLHLATRLIPDYRESRSLTLLADPAQSIYYRGIPWKEAGINIRGGRTRTLAKNFRNTRQILEAARPILDGCDDLKREDEYIPPTSTHHQGPKPTVVSYRNAEEANTFMIEQVIKLCQNNDYRPGDIAILARSGNLYKYLSKPFKQASLKLTQFRDDNFHILENDVKFITMQSAKGLEFPIVFMIGLDDHYVPYIDAKSETKDEDELQERKLFYVSMTRAAERLYLLYPKHNRSHFLYDLDDSTVSAVSAGD